ncbi:hypothetical protein H2200_004110 [Cladophialophora chaetospira]|uniref:Uncharacterized protein n=1 Tax=Cladophialophora chaetospira TaxID=386627 RepID=A0AA39CLS2_9EURO|nr:hypothetical protein H2200_004110 [Cladophialophora chaetospira]
MPALSKSFYARNNRKSFYKRHGSSFPPEGADGEQNCRRISTNGLTCDDIPVPRCSVCVIKARKAPVAAIAERYEERKMVREMPHHKRLKWYHARREAIAKRQTENDSAMMAVDGKANLLCLPLEVRQMIWSFVYGAQSRHSSWSAFHVRSERPLTLVRRPDLHHVCKLLREDAFIFHHSRHDFHVGTIKAFDMKWTKRNGLRLEFMQALTVLQDYLKVQVFSSSPRLQNLRKLTLIRANPHTRLERNGYEYGGYEYEFTRKLRKGRSEKLDIFKTHLSMLAEDFSKTWDHDLLVAWREIELILTAFPRFRVGTVQYRNPRSSERFRLTDQVLQFSTDRTRTPDRGMSIVDTAVLGPNIDEGIAQMRDGRMLPSYPIAMENYQSFEDFVERGLGRAKAIDCHSDERLQMDD